MLEENSDGRDPNERIRRLVRWHYFRNRHLSPIHDDDDLFQDAWIQLNSDSSNRLPPEGSNEKGSTDPGNPSREVLLRRAVSRAASQAFGKLRKRVVRGTATEVSLEFDPADCLPDSDAVMDLQDEIDSLPDEERAVIELLQVGYEGNEIAGMLGVKPQTVSRRKHKAISRLRRSLLVSD